MFTHGNRENCFRFYAFDRILEKKNKSKSILYQMVDTYDFTISMITKFEVEIGLFEKRRQEYHDLMQKIEFLPVDESCIEKAIKIFNELKRENANIDLADLLIGSTAVSHSLRLATLNTRHFNRIPDLQLIDLSKFKSTR